MIKANAWELRRLADVLEALEKVTHEGLVGLEPKEYEAGDWMASHIDESIKIELDPDEVEWVAVFREGS